MTASVEAEFSKDLVDWRKGLWTCVSSTASRQTETGGPLTAEALCFQRDFWNGPGVGASLRNRKMHPCCPASMLRRCDAARGHSMLISRKLLGDQRFPWTLVHDDMVAASGA